MAKKFTFGQQVKVKYRADSDPQKFLLFVREIDKRAGRVAPGIFYELTDGAEAFGLYKPSDVLPLSKKDKTTLGPNCLEVVEQTLKLISQYGRIDGAHHKQWLLDQILRTLLQDKYDRWIKVEENFDPWDTGIAP